MVVAFFQVFVFPLPAFIAIFMLCASPMSMETQLLNNVQNVWTYILPTRTPFNGNTFKSQSHFVEFTEIPRFISLFISSSVKQNRKIFHPQQNISSNILLCDENQKHRIKKRECCVQQSLTSKQLISMTLRSHVTNQLAAVSRCKNTLEPRIDSIVRNQSVSQ